MWACFYGEPDIPLSKVCGELEFVSSLKGFSDISTGEIQQFKVPLSLSQNNKTCCHLCHVRKPLISCTFHVEASFD